MKKINLDAIIKIAEEIRIIGNESTIKDVMNTIVIDDRIAVIKLKGIDYEIWRTDKQDEYDVVKLVYTANSNEKDFHKKMSKEQVLNDIIMKAF